MTQPDNIAIALAKCRRTCHGQFFIHSIFGSEGAKRFRQWFDGPEKFLKGRSQSSKPAGKLFQTARQWFKSAGSRFKARGQAVREVLSNGNGSPSGNFCL